MVQKSFKYNKGITLPKVDFFRANPEVSVLAITKTVAVPLKQTKGPAPVIMVEMGEKVQIGSVLAKSRVATVLSPVSGVVEKVEKRPSCYGGICDHVIIKVGGDDEFKKLPQLTNEELNSDVIRRRINDLGVTDYDGRALYDKLKLDEGDIVDSLVLNACTDEPFLNNNVVLLNEKIDEVIAGAIYMAKCIKVNRIRLAITKLDLEKVQPFIAKMQEVEGDYIFEVDIVPNKYPIGDEFELVKALTQKDVASYLETRKTGIVVVDVYSAYTVFEAVDLGVCDYEKLITLVGVGPNADEIKNVWVRVGSSFSSILKQTLPNENVDIVKIIAGGPMRGVAVAGQNVCVTKTLKGIMFLSSAIANIPLEEDCINCGLCTSVCPRGLLPREIEKHVIKDDIMGAKKFGATACTKCGCCAYVCPAKRNLVQRIIFAKDKINNKGL